MLFPTSSPRSHAAAPYRSPLSISMTFWTFFLHRDPPSRGSYDRDLHGIFFQGVEQSSISSVSPFPINNSLHIKH